MKKKIILLGMCFLGIGMYGQNDCDTTTKEAQEIIQNKSPFTDQSRLVSLLEPCALQGNAESLYYLGLVYLKGLGTNVDLDKAFEYFLSSANKGYANAQYNLGRLYKYGHGCNISYAKAVDWFEKAANSGSPDAAYSLGYMYYKGLGLNQDYNQAVKWFKLGNGPMSKHWLGVCYYFGYGVPQNTNTAIEYLTSNGTKNSKNFLTHIDAQKKQMEEANVAGELQKEVYSDKKIDVAVKNEIKEIEGYDDDLENKDLVGDWKGKFIEYDESGKHIQRVLPISVSFTEDEFGDLKTNIELESQAIENYVLFENNNMFIDNFNFRLNKLYAHNLRKNYIDYQVLGIDLNKVKYNNITYLLGDLDVYINAWKETAPPMSIVLLNNEDVGDEEILSVIENEEEFVNVYPMPFKNEFTFEFELEQDDTINVSLTSINYSQSISIESGKKLEKGKQAYNVNTSHLNNGVYVLKVSTSNKVYTKIVIKN